MFGIIGATAEVENSSASLTCGKVWTISCVSRIAQ